MSEKTEKLQKVLANVGIGSRRDMEELIKAGSVSVDGKVAKLGDRVAGHETIRVNGKIVKTGQTARSICRVLMYNKPEGQMCTKRDPEGRPTVFDRLPQIANGRWLYIGRLDVNTSGLLLFTTDGELANCLMHPSHEVERIYAVRVFGEVTKEHLEQLQTNVELEDGPAHFERVVFVGGEGINQWYNVTLKEGRKREVRRLWEALGLKVSRLKRIKYGAVELGKLPQGGWQELSLPQVNELRASVGLAPETESYVEERKLSVRESFVKNRQVRRAVKNFKSHTKFDNKVGSSYSREERSFEKADFLSEEISFNKNLRNSSSKDRTLDSKRDGKSSSFSRENNRFSRYDDLKQAKKNSEHKNQKRAKTFVDDWDGKKSRFGEGFENGRSNKEKGRNGNFSKNDKHFDKQFNKKSEHKSGNVWSKSSSSSSRTKNLNDRNDRRSHSKRNKYED